jgi:hypothetical protein
MVLTIKTLIRIHKMLMKLAPGCSSISPFPFPFHFLVESFGLLALCAFLFLATFLLFAGFFLTGLNDKRFVNAGVLKLFFLATLTIAFKNLATLFDAKIPLFLACFVKNSFKKSFFLTIGDPFQFFWRPSKGSGPLI